MGRLLVMVDPGVGIEPDALAAAWNADGEAAAVGAARVEAARGADFFPGVVELVVVPLVVNLASSVGYDLLKKLVTDLRHGRKNAPPVELTEASASSCDVVVIVRLAGGSRDSDQSQRARGKS
jgi:hypothetical protein